MKIQRGFAIWFGSILLTLLPVGSYMAARGPQRGGKYVCSEANPETMCNAATTCGSASTPCTVDVKRTANAASVTPGIAGAKSNAPFCVKVGTTVTWNSSQKNTGFVLDFGPSSPFDQGTIIGGSDRSVSAVAKKAGCHKFSVGACVSGAIYGMCGSADTEIVVTQ
jgi:plastocyanin